MSSNNKSKCPCCGFYTIEDPGRFDICSVCFWEDDEIQLDDPYYWGGANHVCLFKARENFKKFGASEESLLKFVRPPTEEERIGAKPEFISVDMQEFAELQCKKGLISLYNSLQDSLTSTTFNENAMQYFRKCVDEITNELKENGIVFDETGKAIDT